VGEATTFVSHAWVMPFASLVAVAEDVERAERARDAARTPYLWLDVLVNDQWAAPGRPFAWWQSVFRSNVERIGHTVLALDFDSLQPLSRIWCLWEIFCSSGAGCRFELRMPPASRDACRNMLMHGDLSKKWSDVDLRAARAFHGDMCRAEVGGCPAEAVGGVCPDDKARILACVDAMPGGVDAITFRIVRSLQEWMLGEAQALLTERAAADRDACALSQLPLQVFFLYNDCGRGAEEALALIRATADERRRLCSEEHPLTLAAEGQLVWCLVGQRHEDAETHCVRVIDAMTRANHDPAAIMGMRSALGVLLHEKGDFPAAEPIIREVAAFRREVHGEIHYLTLNALRRLGRILRDRDRLDAAEATMRDVLAGRRALGVLALTLDALTDLAEVLVRRGGAASLREAAALAGEALAGFRRVKGAEAPETLRAAAILASLAP